MVNSNANKQNYSIWFEQGECSLQSLSFERGKKNDQWSEAELLNMLLHMLKASKSLYQAGILHNDIKTDNYVF